MPMPHPRGQPNRQQQPDHQGKTRLALQVEMSRTRAADHAKGDSRNIRLDKIKNFGSGISVGIHEIALQSGPP